MNRANAGSATPHLQGLWGRPQDQERLSDANHLMWGVADRGHPDPQGTVAMLQCFPFHVAMASTQKRLHHYWRLFVAMPW